ncbi:MAG: hypothetical protein ACPGAE_05310 [Neptuniibacter sp.]
MYTAPQKKFRPKPQSEIEEEIKRCSTALGNVRRIFLADGDAMALSFKQYFWPFVNTCLPFLVFHPTACPEI